MTELHIDVPSLGVEAPSEGFILYTGNRCYGPHSVSLDITVGTFNVSVTMPTPAEDEDDFFMIERGHSRVFIDATAARAITNAYLDYTRRLIREVEELREATR